MNIQKPHFSLPSYAFPIFLIWMASISDLSAQHIGYRKYTVNDGLVQSEVINIFQDSRGLLWLGTRFGASQFDGNKFLTRFDTLDVLKSSIFFFEELSKGVVVVGSSSGYAIFYPEGKMEAFRFPLFVPGATINSWAFNNRVFVSFLRENSVKIYEATETGPKDVTSSFDYLEMFLKDHKGTQLIYDKTYLCFYLIDDHQNVYSIDKQKVTPMNIPNFQGFSKGSDGYVYCISLLQNDKELDRDKALLPNAQGSVQHVIYKMGINSCDQILQFEVENNVILNMFAVTSKGKVIVPDRKNQNIYYYFNKKLSVAKLELDGLTSIYTDDESTLWIGTASGLMHVFPEFFINYSKEEGLFPNTQSLVTDVNGKLWAASFENGLQYFENGRFNKKNIPVLPNNASNVNFLPGSGTDHKGKIHFCIKPYFTITWDGNIMINDKKWPHSSTLYFYDDTATSTYYYGSYIGVVEQKYGETNYKIHPVFSGIRNSARIVSIVRANSKMLFFGGFKSLIIYNGKDFVKLPNADFPDIPGANTMVRDPKGNVWIGNGSGIYLYSNQKFKKIENDYFNNLVLSLKYIEPGRLLIGGSRGIGILDLDKFYLTGKVVIRYFDKNNGFVGGECQQNCVTRDKDGFFWIGVSNGIVKLNASEIPTDMNAPRVYLTKVFNNSNGFDWDALPLQDFGKGEFKLKRSERNIKFEYTGISFSAPENLKFSHKLEGFDKQWSEIGIERYVSYTNLPPGSYVFKIRAYNGTGIWSADTEEYKIKVVAGLFETWYAKLFMLILAIVVTVIGVSIFMTRRTRMLHERFEEERRFAELQFTILRNQLAPHFVFNALNAIGSSIYQDDKEKSYDFLQRFATLIRSTLVHADKTYRKLSEEVEFTKNYLELEKFRFENKFDYTVSIQENISPDIPVPKMIIQTFAENAIKHGLNQKTGKGKLSIRISQEADYLSIIVEDDGIGRIQSMQYNTNSTGKGMEIITEFISLFNRFNDKKILFEVHDILGDSGSLAGTKIIIKLPVKFTYNSLTQIL